ncbi:MAG TPA: cation transporter [Anaerolineales bacterium]
MDRSQALHRRALVLEWITTIWNVVEALVAIGAGLLARSVALLAFGLDSLIEVLSAGAVLWRLLSVGPSAPAKHQEQAEAVALRVVGITFFLLAGYILVSATTSLIGRQAPEASMLGLGLSIASLVVMPGLAFAKQRTAHQMASKSLAADAVETWVCAYLSASLLAGIGLNHFLGWWWADPAAALVMVPFVLWQGRAALREASEGHEENEDG